MRMTTALSGDFPELQKKLAGLSDINRSALMKDVAEGLRSTTMDRFRSRKSPEGEALACLLPAGTGRDRASR